MSAFLGPIHHMMFNKIKTAADRSRAVIELFREKHGEQADEIINAALPDGPVDFGDTSLEELIGGNPIHPFLQSLVDKVETAEATLVTALLYGFPENGRELLGDAFRKHGAETAEKVGGGLCETGAGVEAIANSINQIYLEGMPCDPGGSFSLQAENSLKVDHSACLHMPKWESVGAPVNVMCELMDEWILGFAKKLNPNAEMERLEAIAESAGSCSCLLKV